MPTRISRSVRRSLLVTPVLAGLIAVSAPTAMAAEHSSGSTWSDEGTSEWSVDLSEGSQDWPGWFTRLLADLGIDVGDPRSQSADDADATSKPATSKPAADKPPASKPAADKPPASKPAADKPAASKPAADKGDSAPSAKDGGSKDGVATGATLSRNAALYDAVDAEREARGLPPFKRNEAFGQYAQSWSEDQAARKQLSHVDFDGSKIPPGFTNWAEGVAAGDYGEVGDVEGAKSVVKNMFNTASHNKPLIGEQNFDTIAFGWAVDDAGQSYVTFQYALYDE